MPEGSLHKTPVININSNLLKATVQKKAFYSTSGQTSGQSASAVIVLTPYHMSYSVIHN